MAKETVSEIVVKAIVEHLSLVVLPWKKPFTGSSMPSNLSTLKPYNGINYLITYMFTCILGSSYFLTYKQALAMGGQVKKGAKSIPIQFWSFFDKKDKQGNVIINSKGKTEKLPVGRFYTVYNCAEIDNLQIPVPLAHNQATIDEKASAIVDAYLATDNAPKLSHSISGKAFYSPDAHSVSMPAIEQFNSTSEYYATLFHELAHSTAKALGRKDNVLDESSYGKEELVAELTASMLCTVTGVNNEATNANTAAYLQGWLANIKQNPSYLIQSASQAQKAFDMITGVKKETTEDTTETEC